ncbi:polyprenyl synthetase family protein, partial [Actinoplanes sp. NPDC048791]
MTSPLERAGLRPRVDKALAAFLTTQRSRLLAIDGVLADLADALDDFVLLGGKRLRPAFAYWGYRGAGGADSEQVVAA